MIRVKFCQGICIHVMLAQDPINAWQHITTSQLTCKTDGCSPILWYHQIHQHWVYFTRTELLRRHITAQYSKPHWDIVSFPIERCLAVSALWPTYAVMPALCKLRKMYKCMEIRGTVGTKSLLSSNMITKALEMWKTTLTITWETKYKNRK